MPTKEAIKAAKEIFDNLGRIMREGAKITHEMTGSDPWGPSLSDFKEGEEHTEQEVAKIIDKHFSRKL